MNVVGTCRDLSPQLLKLCCKFIVQWVDLEERNDCLEGLLHEEQGLCEREDNMKKSGGGGIHRINESDRKM